jgi:predicted type IV restriction endonuclease
MGLFEWLGYRSVADIKFRRHNIDIRIDSNGSPLVTIEVKADWALSSKSVSVIQQAYGYALESGTRYVIISNGDRYAVFDRIRGSTREDNLIGEYELSDLTPECVALLESLRASQLPRQRSPARRR